MLASIAFQAARWAGEARVLVQEAVQHGACQARRPQQRRNGLLLQTQGPKRLKVQPGGEAGPAWAWSSAPTLTQEAGDGDELGGHKVAFAAVVAANGEQLGPIAFCQACGAYFWHRVGGLSRPCRGARPYGQLALIRNGRFPASHGRYRYWRVERTAPARQTQLWQLRQQLSACNESRGPSAPARHRLTGKTGPAARAVVAATDRRALLKRYGLTEGDLAAAVRAARPRRRGSTDPEHEEQSDTESLS